MSFVLSETVPWGRRLDEYRAMFDLTDSDMQKRIASFGDGPASFNCEATRLGASITSFDPIYKFNVEELSARIDEVRPLVMDQMRANVGNYVWTKIKSPDELEERRMSAMKIFLSDYPRGLEQRRYICHELPSRVPFDDGHFDIGLSSHFLLMYTSLGLDFHVKAIGSILRACRELRIFPTVDLDGRASNLTSELAKIFGREYTVEVRRVEYEFQRGANQLLIIGR